MSSIFNQIIIYHLHPCSRLEMLSQFIFLLHVFRERERSKGFCLGGLRISGTSEVFVCCQVATSTAPRRSQRDHMCLCCQVVTSAAPRRSQTRSFVCLCCKVVTSAAGVHTRDPLCVCAAKLSRRGTSEVANAILWFHCG